MQMTVMNCAHDKLAREERGSHGPAERDWGGSRRSASLCGEVGRKRRARCCHTQARALGVRPSTGLSLGMGRPVTALCPQLFTRSCCRVPSIISSLHPTNLEAGPRRGHSGSRPRCTEPLLRLGESGHSW